MGPLTGLFLLLMALRVARTEDTVTPVYFTEGGSLTIGAKRATTEEITNILWKFKGNLLAEWVKDVVALGYYEPFRGRATLHTDSARLVIDKMSATDMGVYSSTINQKVQSESYRATLIKEVPQPEVAVIPLTCQVTSLTCNFTCRATVEGAGPVTYSWKLGDGEWGPPESDATIIANKADFAQVETLTCRVKNPVSERESKPEPNPLFGEVDADDSVVGKAVGGFFGALLLALAAGVIGYVVWRKKNSSDNSTQPAAGNGHPAPRPAEESGGQPAEMNPLTGGDSSAPNANSGIEETP